MPATKIRSVKLRFRPINQITSHDEAADRAALVDVTGPVLQETSSRQPTKRRKDTSDTAEALREIEGEPTAKKPKVQSCKRAGALDKSRWTQRELVLLFTELFGTEHDEMFTLFLSNRQVAFR